MPILCVWWGMWVWVRFGVRVRGFGYGIRGLRALRIKTYRLWHSKQQAAPKRACIFGKYPSV